MSQMTVEAMVLEVTLCTATLIGLPVAGKLAVVLMAEEPGSLPPSAPFWLS